LDDANLGLLFGLLTVFIFCSAFFSASETGVMTSNRYRLKHRAKLGDRSAQRVLHLLAQPDRLIGVILVGNNAVNTLAATIATLIGQEVAAATAFPTTPPWRRRRYPDLCAAGVR